VEMLVLGGLDKEKHEKVLTHINNHEDLKNPTPFVMFISKLPTNSHFSLAKIISS